MLRVLHGYAHRLQRQFSRARDDSDRDDDGSDACVMCHASPSDPRVLPRVEIGPGDV